MSKAEKRGPGGEQDIKRPGSLKLHDVFCHREWCHMASVWAGGAGNSGGQRPSLVMCQLRCLDAVLHHHVFTFQKDLASDSVEEG